MINKQIIWAFFSLTSLKSYIWILSIAAWMFSLIERTVDLLMYGHFTALELAQVLVMAIGLMGLFILKPRLPKFGDESSLG